jgi:hypothetical protein
MQSADAQLRIRRHFVTPLRQRVIIEASQAISPEICRYSAGVPSADELIAVPPIAQFPLDEAISFQLLSKENSNRCFAHISYST